jgi:hypothetical protein
MPLGGRFPSLFILAGPLVLPRASLSAQRARAKGG